MSKTAKTTAILNELLRIKGRKQLLKPRQVLEAARDKDSVLHSYFCWDNKIAGERYRLDQARDLIRSFRIEATDDTTRLPKREFISLAHDRVDNRNSDGAGGYRSTKDVISSPQLRKMLLDSFRAELRHLIERHKPLAAGYPELARLLEAVELAGGLVSLTLADAGH